MIAELTHAADAVGRKPDCRAVVLAAEGDVFCAGGDLNWMREQMDAEPDARREQATALAMMLKALNEVPVPLIGRVQGDAFGGGVGLMSICDTVVAVEGSKFGLTETSLGLIPATIGPYVAARLGEANARRVFYSSKLFSAELAHSFGLVSVLVPPSQLGEAVEAEVAPYLSCAPGAVAEAKALLRMLTSPVDDAMIEASIEALLVRWNSAEAQERTAAFFDKRQSS